jgi:hypothetical protein
MSVLTVTTPYVDGGTVTSTNLNALVGAATFSATSVDNITTEISGGSIVVRDAGITKPKLSAILQGITERSGTAYIGGDKTGNTRGTGALDIQSTRTGITRIAVGNNSVAVGNDNLAFNSAVAFGDTNTASGYSSITIGKSNVVSESFGLGLGYYNVASDYGAMAIGGNNESSGENSMGIGLNNTSSGYKAIAIGRNVINSATNSLEIGRWNTLQDDRQFAIKLTENGGVAFTLANAIPAPTDQATLGAEASTQLGRDMFTIQRNGTAFTLYFNDAGAIKSLALGSVA